MTDEQRHAAQTLIPAAFEAAVPLQGAALAAYPISPAPSRALHVQGAAIDAPYVVHAPARATTRLGQAAAILGDVTMAAALPLAIASVPALAIWGIYLAVVLVLALTGLR